MIMWVLLHVHEHQYSAFSHTYSHVRKRCSFVHCSLKQKSVLCYNCLFHRFQIYFLMIYSPQYRFYDLCAWRCTSWIGSSRKSTILNLLFVSLSNNKFSFLWATIFKNAQLLCLSFSCRYHHLQAIARLHSLLFTYLAQPCAAFGSGMQATRVPGEI